MTIAVGEDPLRELVDKLGEGKANERTAVVIHDQMMRNLDDVGRVYGEPTRSPA